jgi:hypothetical protein
MRPQVKQILQLNRLRSEGRINLAEFLASANRVIEDVFLNGQVSQLKKILGEGGPVHEKSNHR